MHESSLVKFVAFLDEYCGSSAETKSKSILDVGSASYMGHTSYRPLAEGRGLRYVGLDMQPGLNVDIVSKNPVVYSEVATESYDFIVSGQTFEHNPFFWVSFCEMARILKQGGKMLVIAPSAGIVHRYPFDCWRYYPDSWMALCAISGMRIDEVIFEPPRLGELIGGGRWRDSAVVATKPVLEPGEEAEAFYRRIAGFTAPFEAEGFDLAVVEANLGPVFKRYARRVRTKRGASMHAQAESDAPVGK